MNQGYSFFLFCYKPFAMNSTIFSSLFNRFTTWPSLSEFLTSEEGGFLRVSDRSTPENPFALIRYVKGKSTLTLPHVRAFRSVVWDTLENRPVSVTPFKSEDGESLPETEGEATTDYTVERFVDGVMIGAFWDRYSNQWRIHTRSTLDGNSRFFSQTKTFKQMFDEFAVLSGLDWSAMDKACSYTWLLQHPENRVVVPVTRVTATLVQKVSLTLGVLVCDNSVTKPLEMLSPLATWTDVRARLADWNTRFKHTVQGLVVKDNAGRRWKIRTAEYNRVRRLRTNTARLDYLWLTMWRNGGLSEYLTLFPEERRSSEQVINQWKRITNDVFHIYVDTFKARTLDKKAIHPKYRPFVYGLHGLYMETLKPAGKTVVWKTVLDYMNGRDVAQMLFAINWDVRQAAKQFPTIPLEPQVTVGTAFDDDKDTPDLGPRPVRSTTANATATATATDATATATAAADTEDYSDMPELVPIQPAHATAPMPASVTPPGGDSGYDIVD